MADVKWVSFNLNDQVRVRLTEHGRSILRGQHEQLNAFVIKRNPYAKPLAFTLKEDEDGWSTWQLWGLMTHFGGHIAMTLPPPFASQIEFATKEQP